MASTPAYLSGTLKTHVSNVIAEVEYVNNHKDRLSNVIAEVEYSNDHKDRISNIIVLVEYQLGGRSSKSAYTEAPAESASDHVTTYLIGSEITSDHIPAFALSTATTTTTLSSFAEGSEQQVEVSHAVSAFVVGVGVLSGLVYGYTIGMEIGVSSSPAFSEGYSAGTSSRPAHTQGSSSGTISTPSYVAGVVQGNAVLQSFLYGNTASLSSIQAFIVSGFYANKLSAYLFGISDLIRSNIPTYSNGAFGSTGSVSAFSDGQEPNSSTTGYTRGKSVTTSVAHAYVAAPQVTSIHAFIRGAYFIHLPTIHVYLTTYPVINGKTSSYIKANIATKSKKSAYLTTPYTKGNTPVFTAGNINTMIWIAALIPGEESAGTSIKDNLHGYSSGYDPNAVDISSSVQAYLSGYPTSSVGSYANGVILSTTQLGVFLQANIFASNSISAFTPGLTGVVVSTKFGYCIGKIRNSVSACVVVREGDDPMASVDYIYLQTSDGGATKSKKFRVIAQDYDDGTLEKAENIERTIGGGIDHSVGAVYVTWSPIIRVRHTETETDYGTVADLEYFYTLNNPNATPSNDITFVDHHQVSHTVHTVGKLTKNLMGCAIEGTEAWYLYRIQFIEVG